MYKVYKMSNSVFRNFVNTISVVTVLAFFFGGAVHAQTEEGAREGGDLAPPLYDECAGCHNLKENDLAPMHCGTFGREAGTVPGFAYSPAMRESGIVWDEEHLDEFLKSPFTYVSGTLMGYFGIHDDDARAEMIAFLKSLTPDSPLCSG